MTPNRAEARSTSTPQALKIFTIISQAGEAGITRKEIAIKLEKPRLNKWDTALLDLMINEGLVTATMRPIIERPHITEHVYRAKVEG